MPSKTPTMIITGTSRGIGRFLAEYYLGRQFRVFGCSRGVSVIDDERYCHFSLDVSDEKAVKTMFMEVRGQAGRLDALVNNAGVASMNHSLLTPLSTVSKVMDVNFTGTFLFCREAAKMMKKDRSGRIVNFSTVAVPLRLEGEAVYAASKAAVESLTRVLARELAADGITVNAVGPTPVETDLIRSVPKEKIESILQSQAIHRLGIFEDVVNVVDFLIRPESEFITGQVIYLGGP